MEYDLGSLHCQVGVRKKEVTRIDEGRIALKISAQRAPDVLEFGKRGPYQVR